MANIQNSSFVDTVNSTSTPLNAAATFTGTARNVEQFSRIVVSCNTDKIGTLSIEFSSDGTNWDSVSSFAIDATTPNEFSVFVVAKFMRVVLTNTDVAIQTYLRLQTLLCVQYEDTAKIDSDYYPIISTTIGQDKQHVDPSGNLKTRAAVLTDETSFRDDFSGVALGTEWIQSIGTGSLAVANSLATIGSGTAAGMTMISRLGDYCPMTARAKFSVSQRIANQKIRFGFIQRIGGVIEQGAYFELSGTTNTALTCISQSTSAATGTESKTITIPYISTSASSLFYKIDLSNNLASFSISDDGDNFAIVAKCATHIPGPYSLLDIEFSTENAAIVANTDLIADFVFLNNMNRVQTDNDFAYEPSPVSLYASTDRGNTKELSSTSEGHLQVAILGPTLPFGSLHTEVLTPIFQSDAVYGINDGQVSTGVQLSGTVVSTDGTFTISTGVTSGAFAEIQSRKRLRYRAGQGIVGRFAGLFNTPVANSYQLMGFGHAEDGVYFGYQGTAFGVLHVRGGVREVQTLTVTVGATVAGNVTITLNSVAFLVAVTNASNVQRTVWEIANGTYTGWKAYSNGATVVFLADSAGNKAGTFSFGAGATGSAATIAETKAGIASVDTFYPQTEWNGDKLDGNGSSGVLADWTKGNVFQIGIQYLGFGSISFQVETNSTDANKAVWTTVHILKFPNALTLCSFRNPSFPFTAVAYSAGSTTNLTMKLGSFAGFIEGQKMLHGNRFTYLRISTTVGAASIQALFTILSARVYRTISSQVVVNILSFTGSLKHTSPCVYYLIKNGTLAGNPNFASYGTNSTTLWDTAATTVATTNNEQILWTGHIGDTGQLIDKFTGATYNIDELTLQPGEWLTLGAMATTGSPSYVTGSINTREDQ
jgi:hypothetical protein